MSDNPIDKDKTTDRPHSLEYPHHRGSQVVKPEDQGKAKGNAMKAMEGQTDQQLQQIREQMELLANQAQKIQDRKLISEKIYQAEMRFQPLIMHNYHLYQRDNGGYVLSMVGPDQWGRSGCPYQWLAHVQMMPDHTWDILESEEELS